MQTVPSGRPAASLCALLLLCFRPVFAGTAPEAPASYHARPAGEEEPQEGWSFSASVYSYFPAGASNYAQPTLTADRDWLHLEARYNYEELDTGSAWVGYNLGGGDKVAWEFTPMIGATFGKLSGVGPGYRGSAQWRGLELDSEGEYVIDTANSSDSYFYNWSELRLSVLDRVSLGVVVQHTRVYQSDREIQRGLLAGFAYKRLDVTGYVFNPDDDQRFAVIALTLNW